MGISRPSTGSPACFLAPLVLAIHRLRLVSPIPELRVMGSRLFGENRL